MPRRIKVECSEEHQEEIIIGISDKIPRCPTCKKAREIIWDQQGAQGAPGFRVQGMTKNFR